MQSNYDQDLLAYFTDAEHLLSLFKESVAAQTLPKRIFVIHGVGGVGKSSLLRMFRLHCKGTRVSVALASGDEAKSAFDVLARWTDDLKADNVALSSFNKTFKRYRAIQAEVGEQAKKAQDTRKRITDIAGKAASKTAEEIAAAAVGAAIGSVIPGIGTISSAWGGMGAEALVDLLRGFLTKPSIDLLLDPAKKLTDDFLADVADAADKHRIVLMLDTYEQITVLDDWVRDVAQQLHPNVLLVISGRAMVNWSRTWQSWLAHAQVEELEPMSEEDMRHLVPRYYAAMRDGEPNPAQVDAIIPFARGLPMVVTSAVQLWVQYGVKDFQAIKPQVVANLVDRLMEGVPNALIPALEAAAAVRWFNRPILRAVTGLADVREVYTELRRFPFVRARAEGLALHDAVREIIDDNLRVQDSERHHELHERAAVYFEGRLETATGEEAERLGLERLYHRIHADEEAGIKLFQEMAEELVRYQPISQLRALLNDANTYSLEMENSRLWIEYYGTRLAHLVARLEDAEKVYQAMSENDRAEPKLRAYAMCDWGQILVRYRRLGQPGGSERAIAVLEHCQRVAPQIDSKVILSLSHRMGVHIFNGEWEKGLALLEQQRQFFQGQGNKHGVIHTYGNIKGLYAGWGNWKKAFETQRRALEELETLSSLPWLRVRLARYPWASIWSGRYHEAEQELKAALSFVTQSEDAHMIAEYSRLLGLVLGLQEKYREANRNFSEALGGYESLGKRFKDSIASTQKFAGVILARRGEWVEAEKRLTHSLRTAREMHTDIKLPEVLDRLGEIRELGLRDWLGAESYYRQCLDLRRTGRRYWECGALTGLVRVKHAQGDYAAVPPLLAEAEQLAQQFEYNDHLASLRLTQGHIAWDGKAFEVSKVLEGMTHFDAVLRYYQHALIHALRYNRFLLDEALSGRPQGSPLRPIVPLCLERDKEGRRMLLALQDWWKTGVNDIGAPRPDTISSIPQGIALLEAERIARERELGDGSAQKTVAEQIEAALQNHGVG